MQIIIVGCGKVGSSLAASLIEMDHDVIIVENDPKLIQNADDLDCIKITGVPIDRDVLKKAGIETADVLCAVTQTDNVNIMVSQVASDIFSVPRILTRVFNPVNRQVFDAFGLDTICSTQLTVEAFIRKITGENVERVLQIAENPIVFTQVPVEKSLIDQKLKDLTTNDGKLVFGLLRDGVLHLANEDLKIKQDDRLVLANKES